MCVSILDFQFYFIDLHLQPCIISTCLDQHHFVVSFDIRKCIQFSRLFCLLQFGVFTIPYDYQNHLVHSYNDVSWDSYGEHIESVDKCGEYSYFNKSHLLIINMRCFSSRLDMVQFFSAFCGFQIIKFLLCEICAQCFVFFFFFFHIIVKEMFFLI